MYWNLHVIALLPGVSVMNRNIGCIEIYLFGRWLLHLKMNRNIGCIEIKQSLTFYNAPKLMNRNIGCIEIAELFRQKCELTDEP